MKKKHNLKVFECFVQGVSCMLYLACLCWLACCVFWGWRYELGEGLYIGWCSGTLAICAGVCLVFSCKTNTEEKPWVSLSIPLSLFSFSLFPSFSFTHNHMWICLYMESKSYISFFSAYAYQPSRGTIYSAGVPSRRDAQSTYDKNAYVWQMIKQLTRPVQVNTVYRNDKATQFVHVHLFSVQICKYVDLHKTWKHCMFVGLKIVKLCQFCANTWSNST